MTYRSALAFAAMALASISSAAFTVEPYAVLFLLFFLGGIERLSGKREIKKACEIKRRVVQAANLEIINLQVISNWQHCLNLCFVVKQDLDHF